MMASWSRSGLACVWILCCALSFSVCGGSTHKRVCYLSSWARYRQGAGTFSIADVDPFLCSHIIYCFGAFDAQGNLQPTIQYDEYPQLQALKQRNPDLKLLLAVGGWNFGSGPFSDMALNPAKRGRFVQSVVTFMHRRGFDGLDLDWEYPGSRAGSRPSDKANFVILCKELKEAFQAANKQLILSAAVAAASSRMDPGYNIAELDRYLDLWNLMTYDYHGGWDSAAGHNSPLYSQSDNLSVEWTAEEYVRRGASKHKVMVGLPMYGHTFTLSSASQNRPGARAVKGPRGQHTQEAGFWAYYEVCKEISKGAGEVRRDIEAGVPYYVNGRNWVSYDDVESIREKTRWLKKNGYGGYMVWSIDMDMLDTSQCPTHTSPFPLISAANAILEDSAEPGTPEGVSKVRPSTWRPSVYRTTTRRPRPTWVRPTTTRRPGPGSQTGAGSHTGSGSHLGVGSQINGFSCIGKPNQNYKDPASHCKFIICYNDRAYSHRCAKGTAFDEELKSCNWPKQHQKC